ncbi:terminase family protein [Sphingosinicella sp. LHD-64]|uniref:DNA-packaging protein n=1 Tax=Sphingosinicella sp. LHD-64 TaxID=3072139 RepID=UPI00280EFBEE|nr:terminase family protein [Sphingosinicella sp. LHD-64]MDQ8757834.1 terminase family protein [Sphingosinicella sp. LHD-64]
MSRHPMAEQARLLAGTDAATAWRLLTQMTPADVLRFDVSFESWADDGQHPPDGEGWRTWLMMAGRGYGKTRAGAEWITGLATRRKGCAIALVGATIDEVRKVMIEGESGLIAVGKRYGLRPRWEPSLGRLSWRGGSVAYCYSGENPDGLRGPQHHFAWCDELAKWARPEATWDNLQFGLRAGPRPRALVTTTPRPIPLLQRLKGGRRTVVTTGRTDRNITLSADFVDLMVETYGGTRLGRQELDGELFDEVEGALWTRALIEKRRARAPDTFRRVLVGVDPPAGAAGTCGIVVCGLGVDGIGYVLDDCSVAGRSPEGWARAVADAAASWGADRIVAETNQGGAMVESILRGVDAALPVRPVTARYGKAQRADPVALLFERGKALFAGAFPALEDELCGLVAGGDHGRPGRSPDRADAMVWAMAELTGGVAKEPRVRAL